MDIYRNNKLLSSDMQSIVIDASAAAYIRSVESEKGEKGYAVCSADGTQLAVFSTKDAAFFAARQHDLEPVYTH